MNYSITHELEDQIIAVLVEGEMELGGFTRMLDEVGVKILQTQCYDLLVDVTQLKVKLSFLDLMTLPGIMHTTLRKHQIEASALRRAVVLPKDSNVREMHKIFAQYIGGSLKNFPNQEDAKHWLKEAKNA